MDNIRYSDEDLRKRVARFSDLQGSGSGFPDSDLPGCQRKLYNILGFRPPATDDPSVISPIGSVNSTQAPIDLLEGYSLAIVECTPGNGTVLHNHDTTESFIVVSGTWRFRANEDEDIYVDLGPLDTVSFPAGLPRRFENIKAPGDDPEAPSHMLVLITADSPTAVMEPDVMAEARRSGKFTPAHLS